MLNKNRQLLPSNLSIENLQRFIDVWPGWESGSIGAMNRITVAVRKPVVCLTVWMIKQTLLIWLIQSIKLMVVTLILSISQLASVDSHPLCQCWYREPHQRNHFSESIYNRIKMTTLIVDRLSSPGSNNRRFLFFQAGDLRHQRRLKSQPDNHHKAVRQPCDSQTI